MASNDHHPLDSARPVRPDRHRRREPISKESNESRNIHPTQIEPIDTSVKSKNPDEKEKDRAKRSAEDREATDTSVWWIAVGSEFIGTFIHVLLGLGIECLARVASTESSDFEDYLPKLGWGLSWATAFFVAGGLSGGHFNGTVTFAFFLYGKISVFTMLFYWLAQMLAALLAGFITYILYYYPLERRFGLDETKHLFVGSAFGGAINPSVTYWAFMWAVAGSLLATFLLVFIVLAITDQSNMHIPRSMYGLLIGLVGYTPVLLICSYYYYGCVVINIWVDPVTRLFTLFSWEHDYLNAIGGWIGCIVGAAVATGIYHLIITLHVHPTSDQLNAPVGGPRDSRSNTAIRP